MKRGYKYKTGVFGTDAERFISSLYQLMLNPSGTRRPDLISVNGKYKPKLAMEVKSGKRKGVLVDYQLHYPLTVSEDFNLEARSREEMLRDVDWKEMVQKDTRKDIACYYCLVDRIDGLKSDELDRPYSAIKMRFGEQFIFPHQYTFSAFVAAVKTRIPKDRGIEKCPFTPKKIANNIRKQIREDVLGIQEYEQRKLDKNSWQDIHARDFNAIYFEDGALHRDEEHTTKLGTLRVDIIRKLMSDMNLPTDKLRRVEISGPEGYKIRVLAEPKHEKLFDENLRDTVEGRREIIEEVSREREESVSLLEKIVPSSQGYLFANGGVAHEREDYSIHNLSVGEIMKLKRLVFWLPERESVVEEVPF